MDSGLIGRREKVSAGKLHAAQYIIAMVLLVLSVGLWRLQVIGAETYRAMADENRIRKVPVLAPRGRIFDREGRILVDNYPSVSCYLLPQQVKDLNKDLPEIARGLDLTVAQIQATLKKYRYAPRFQPLPLKQDITPDEQAFVEAHRNELPELQMLDEQRRLYPRDGFAAHLIGYVGEVSENDLNESRYAFYKAGDGWARAALKKPMTTFCAARMARAMCL
jgi:penicillin-binding protein 2